MAMDLFKNFAYGTIVIAPTPPNLGTTLTVGSGHSARFPAPPFSASVWPIGVPADPTNAEILRVTAISGDQWTITRTQEGSTARAILNTDQVAQALTAKAIADLKADCLAAAQAWVNGQGFATQAWVNGQGFALKSYVDSQDTAVENWVIANFAQTSWVQANYALASTPFLLPRLQNVAAAATCTPNVDAADMVTVNALNQGMTFINPAGTPHDGQMLIIRIRDDGTARPLAWQSQYYSMNSYLTLPTATVALRTIHAGFRWNAFYAVWALIALTQE